MSSNQQILLGEGAGSAPAVYVEDVFSTYLYASTSGTDNQVINGIDLSTKSGLVWSKSRTRASTNHYWIDTVRGSSSGNTNALVSNTTAAQSSGANLDYLVFNSNGYTAKPVVGGGELGTNTYYGDLVSWTFREQAKFFDVVTWTATGSEIVSHNLQSVPGCVIYKNTSGTSNWFVVSRKSDNSYAYALLNTTGTAGSVASPTAAGLTSTTFDPSQIYGTVSGQTYVGYFFAHDAGGFGLAGTDNVISCGSFTTDGAGAATVSLGYEPQWVMTKSSSGVSAWRMFDTMRGLTVAGQNDALLQAQDAAAEIINSDYCSPTATGFTIDGHSGSATHIYIAIRRGPMKVPTVGTSVFAPFASSGATGTQLTTNFPVDSGWFDARGGDSNNASVLDRLRGVPSTSTDTAANRFLKTSATAAETTTTVNGYEWWNTGIRIGPYYATYSTVYWLFGRAPGFFDVVCDTGTGAAHTITHNLGVPAELLIRKMRSGPSNWWCYNSIVGGTKSIKLNDSGTYNTSIVYWNNTDSTSTTFSVGTTAEVNQSGSTFVTYLFATCAGVSKVGSYTGNGSSQTIACGFAAGSRFVMIKRTDSTGDWYVWDSARGIVAGNDPHLSLNTTAAEVTTDDSVDTDNSGFIVNQDAATNVNVTSATYIFLAIA